MEGLHAVCKPSWLIQRDDHMLFMHFPCRQGRLKPLPLPSIDCALLAASVCC